MHGSIKALLFGSTHAPRQVATLETQLTTMDAEYDKCNLAMANGEVSAYDQKLPNRKSLQVSECYSSHSFETTLQAWHLLDGKVCQ